jgi:hypothetical protein
MCEDRGMPDNEQTPITIALSPAQVDAVVRAASREQGPSIATIIATSLARPHTDRSAADEPGARDARTELFAADVDDSRLSRSLLRGFSLLAGFAPDGAERGIVELADDLGMSPSTAHRYALTLVELGLLERCPTTRKYRLPAV